MSGMPSVSRILTAASLALASLGPIRSEDCNGNGIDDLEDIRSAPFRFEVVPVTPLSGFVRDIAAVDFDGDGGKDLAGISRSHSEVVVLLQSEDFARGPRAGLSSPPSAVTPADLDRDGDQDLVIASEGPPSILIAWNDAGALRLEPQDAGVTAALTDLIAADLDADGDADVAGTSSFEIVILENDVTNRLSRGPDIPIGSNPVSILATDLDGDLDIDLATANTLGDEFPGNVSILFNDGRGVFTVPRNFGADADPRAIAAMDTDGDGHPDLVAAGASLEVYRNRGDASFAEARSIASGVSGTSLCVLDADEDGAADMAAGTSMNRISIFLHAEDGDFRPGPSLPLSSEPLAVVAGDLDADGDDDIASVGGTLAIFFFESGLESSVSFPVGGRSSVHMTADMDGDGDADVINAVADEPARGFVRILENDGNAEFGSLGAVPTTGYPYRMAVGDWEADADIDVAITTSGGSVMAFRNDATDLLDVATLGIGGNVTALAAGDVDEDSRDDLVVGSESEGLTIFSSGSAGFVRGGRLAFAGMFPYYTAAADLDGDGSLDLVSVTGDTHKVVLHWNEGGGVFRGDPPLAGGSYPLQVAPADLDGDGDPDLAVVNYGGEGARTFTNAGGRRFGPGTVKPAGASPMTILASDFDSDADVDLACSGNELSLVVNEGAGLFSPGKTITPIAGHTTWLSTADFDGDGALDLGLGVTSFEGGGITLFLSRSRMATSLDANGDLVPDECQAGFFHRGDADATGAVDLTDALAVLRHLFLGDPAPSCLDAADVDDSGDLAITDGIFLLDHLFLGGAAPPSPGPPPGPCGLDPPLKSLGCLDYPGC
jgi:hypothetical protein